MSSLPPSDIGYLLELGKIHKEFPTLEIFECDALLRARVSVSVAAAPIPDSQSITSIEAQMQRIVEQKQQHAIAHPSSPPLSSEAPTYEPVRIQPTPIPAPVPTPAPAPRIQSALSGSASASASASSPVPMTSTAQQSFRAPIATYRRGRNGLQEPIAKSWANIVEENE